MQGQQSRAGATPGASTPLIKVLLVVLVAAAAVTFRIFLGSSDHLDLPSTPKATSTSLLFETITTTVTETIPVPTQDTVEPSTMSASEQT